MGERSELREIQKLEGHKGKVWSVVWNPVAGTDGTPAILASCGSDNTVRIWKQYPAISAFECLATIRGAQTGTVRSCSWSPEGDLLAIANYDGTTSLWDMNNFKHLYDLKGHKAEVVSVSWNISGHLATCSSNSVWIWGLYESEKYKPVGKFIHEEDVEMVQWHPFKDILFSCGCDEIIKVWRRFSDYNEWSFAEDLNGHMSKVCSMSFNATGDKMVTSSADLSIKVWAEERMQSGGDHERGGYQPCDNVKFMYEIIVPQYPIHRQFYSNQLSLNEKRGQRAILVICCNTTLSYTMLYFFKHPNDNCFPPTLLAWFKVTGERGNTLYGYHKQTIFSVHWSSEGIIASGAADGVICLFKENKDGLSLERRGAVYELLLTKEKAHETKINSVQWAPKESSDAMYELFLKKEKAHETDVNLVHQSPKLLETNKVMDKFLLTKEKANETVVTAVQWTSKVNSQEVAGKKRSYENLVEWAPKSQERSETMPEFLLTKKKAHEMDVKSVQQVPKLQEKCNDMCTLLMPKEKAKEKEKANETEVTAMQCAPELLRLDFMITTIIFGRRFLG
ncbi:uncharacterized protein LOC141691758 [Apium graveolens]|uniref:uncharacterized protein LOC141691758 n=1 Tax=Apium graveolens TaxID=4045 RepID=UPI003D79104C